jgi:opacity protein-like surface antigen
MNLKKILTIFLGTSLTTISLSQTERFSLSLGASYTIPRKDIKEDFDLLKGLEISFEKPINPKSSIGASYYSGYKWGNQLQTRDLESKINAYELSVFYNHKLNTSSGIKPFYKIGIGYGQFKLEESKEQKRTIKSTNGETLNFGIGAKIDLNKKKNKGIYFGIENEFFIPNKKTNKKYSNIKINVGIDLKRCHRDRLK